MNLLQVISPYEEKPTDCTAAITNSKTTIRFGIEGKGWRVLTYNSHVTEEELRDMFENPQNWDGVLVGPGNPKDCDREARRLSRRIAKAFSFGLRY